MVQRGLQINQADLVVGCDFFDFLLDVGIPVPGAGTKAGMSVTDWRETANPYFTTGIDFAKRCDQIGVIPYKIVPVVGPVTGVRVVQSQVDNNHISCVFQGLAILLLLGIWAVSFS